MEKNFVAYYRKSPGGNKTYRELKTSLGISAQKTAVANYCRSVNGNNCLENFGIIAEFEDLESGKNDNRPELEKALIYCKENDCVLVIARLDRLSRNLTFISKLRDSEIEFICCDMPSANKMMIGIMAVLAQEERELISKRTKEALKEKVRKEVEAGNLNYRLGCPEVGSIIKSGEDKGKVYRGLGGNKLAKENMKAVFKLRADNDECLQRAKIFIKDQRMKLRTLNEITSDLILFGFKTSKGNNFSQSQVYNMFDKEVEEKNKEYWKVKKTNHANSLRAKWL